MRLLFTGGGGAASDALALMLESRYDVHFCDADYEARPPSVAHDHWHAVLPASLGSFTMGVADLCRELAVDLLIPGVDEELLKLAMARDWGVLPCPMLLPESVVVATHLDKLASMRHLASLGIPVPITWRWGVVKPREGRGSRGVSILGHSDGNIVQEYLDGQEYTVTVLADRQKRLRAIVPVKVGKKKGITLRAETDADPAVIALCRQIHGADPFSGCINIQCIKSADGTVKPFEINPRVSTTTCLAIAAGVDVFALYLDEGPVNGLAPFENGRPLRRSWRTVFAA